MDPDGFSPNIEGQISISQQKLMHRGGQNQSLLFYL